MKKGRLKEGVYGKVRVKVTGLGNYFYYRFVATFWRF